MSKITNYTIIDARPAHCNQYKVRIGWMLGDGEGEKDTFHYFDSAGIEEAIEVLNWASDNTNRIEDGEYDFQEDQELTEGLERFKKVFGHWPADDLSDYYYCYRDVGMTYFNDYGVELRVRLEYK